MSSRLPSRVPTARAAIAVATVVLLAAGGLAVGPSTVAAEVTADRDPGTVTITASGVNASDEADFEVDVGEGTITETAEQREDVYEITASVETLADEAGNVDLSNVTVEVSHDGDTVGNDTVRLQHATFSGVQSYGADLRLPLSEGAGLEGADLSLDAEPFDDPLDASVEDGEVVVDGDTFESRTDEDEELEVWLSIDGEEVSTEHASVSTDRPVGSVERTTPRRIRIRVPTVDEPPDRIDVSVVDPVEYETELTDNRTVADGAAAVFEFAVTDIEADEESLLDARLVVEHNGSELVNETLPLSYVEFGRTPARIDGDSLVVPLNDTNGLGEGDAFDLAVDAGDEPTEVEATVENDATAVSVPLETFRESVGPTVEVSAHAAFVPGGVDHPSAGTVETAIRPTADGVVLWSPFVEADETYRVRVDTDSGTYVNETTPTVEGTLSLPDSMWSVEEADVTLGTADGTPFDGAGVRNVGRYELSGVLDDQVLELDTGIGDLRGIVVDGERLRYVDADAEDLQVSERRLDLSAVDVSGDDELLVLTADGVAIVDTRTRDDGLAASSGFLDRFLLVLALFLVVTFVSGIVGTVLSRHGVRTPKALGVITIIGVLVGALFTLLALLSIDVAPLPGWEVPPSPGLKGLLLVGVVTGGLASSLSYAALAPRKAPSQGSSRTSPDAGGATTSTFSLDVTVTDGGGPLEGEATVVATPKRGNNDSRSETVRNGRGSIQLPEGRWELRAEHGSYDSGPVTASQFDREVTLEVPLPEVSVTVEDEVRDVPVPDATVELEAAGERLRETTDREGTASFDPPSEANRLELTVDHEKYESFSTETTLDERNKRATVPLVPLTERVRLTTTVDGTRTGGMSVVIEPLEEFLRSYYGERLERESGSDGSIELDEVVVGRYRIRPELPDARAGLYDVDEREVTVRDDGPIDRSLDARFGWSLSADQRDRVSTLRGRIAALGDRSGRDVTIPRYYGTVVEQMVDAVETAERRGDGFVTGEVHPDELVDATLSAAESCLDGIERAMSTKRNVDLFAACSDMGDARISWSGEFDLDELFERLDGDPISQRSSLAGRLETVSERIDSERQSLSEVAPAREVLDQMRDQVQQARGDDGVDETVAYYAVDRVLDAIEELFERDALRQRLSQTVF